jgi:hypothetical protein
MCEKCDHIEQKIAHYRRLAVHITDTQTLNGITALIGQMTTKKAALGCVSPTKH